MANDIEKTTGVEHVAHHDEKKNIDASEIERVMTPDDDLKKDHQDYGRIDAEVAKYANAARIEITPSEDKRLKRMIDKRVLTIMVFTYFLQALDKGTLSFTSIMGLQTDLNLVGQQFSWLTTCIYIAILIVEYPINRLIQVLPIAKFLGTCIIVWSAILACHAAAHNFAGMVALRTLLGIFEAVCQPTFLIMSSMWYKREEQALMVSFWYAMNGMQQIVGGLLAYCFSLIHSGPIKSWQAIFITYGCFSAIWGVFVIWYLPDSPMRAKCFSEEDKRLMVERVRSNQTGLQNKKFRKEQMWEAFTDVQCWCYCLIQICTTLPTGGLGAFANIIIKGFGFTTLQTQLLAMVLGAYIIIILFSSAWLVKKTQQNILIMAIFCLPSFAGTIVLMTVENTSTATEAGLLISYYVVLSFWAAQGLGMSMLSRNVAGQTKKSVAVTMNFVAWATGNAIGPQVFLKWNAPRYFIAFSTHLGCYTLLILTLIALRWTLSKRNSQRNEAAAAGVHEASDDAMVHAFEDMTDKENPNFRYMI
ncbi:putative transporter [Pseudocercospora fuligena]|uniref:Putative transporter n=1 Tax=Pseudocercospora fuligena TaxID=685502 RepID=A0A8H6RH02_9PEZI|nr:putative transporter [Pseudocercospora fuligena]